MRTRCTVSLTLIFALISFGTVFPAQAQRRRTPARQRSGTTTSTQRQRQPAQRRAPAATESRLTGTYNLDPVNSNDPRAVAARSTRHLSGDEREAAYELLMRRLTPPSRLAIERRGRTVSIASTRARQITFEADGQERVEQARDGHTVRTRAAIHHDQFGDHLTVSSTGSRDDEYIVNFDPINQGRRLRVTRRIYLEGLPQPIIVQSTYDKTDAVARWDIYGTEPPAQQPGLGERAQRSRPQQPPAARRQEPPAPRTRERQQPVPPVLEERREEVFVVPNGAVIIAVLNDNLSTGQTRVGDRFTMTVREPGQYEGATIEGTVSQVERSGPFTGRAELSLNFERIRLRDGRTAEFAGIIESVRTAGGEEVRVESSEQTSVQESDNQTDRTVQRTAIGAAVGAVIGAIAGGGRGAAIGAAIGAGAGAGSVYVQGRDDLELVSGTEVTIRASAPAQQQNFGDFR